MKKVWVIALLGITAALSFAVGAQTGAITVETRTGLTVETCLGHNICINKGATTKLVHHFLFNPAMPAVCSKVPEVETRYETSTRSTTGQYLYKAGCSLIPDQAIDAYELKFVVFDIFGRHVRTLVAAAIRPIAEKDPFFVSGTWNLYSENEVGLHYMSVAYVSRVKLATGRVIVADDKAVAAAIRKLTNTFDEGQLAPKAPTPQ